MAEQKKEKNKKDRSSSLVIRKMTAADLPLCRHLVNEAGWNQLDLDWLRAMDLEPEGCFVAEADRMPVATTTTCCFGNVAWIAMVLVDKKFRGHGIARQLVEHAITYLQQDTIATIRLDATALGQGLYEKLGFKAEYEVARYAGNSVVDQDKNKNLARFYSDISGMASIARLDREATGTRRETFIEKLAENDSCPFFYINDDGGTTGYAGCREGGNAIQIGPAIALTADAGCRLLNAVASHFQEKKTYIDIPKQNTFAVEWAETNGFTEQRRFMRMYLGEKIADLPEQIWASSGPEKG